MDPLTVSADDLALIDVAKPDLDAVIQVRARSSGVVVCAARIWDFQQWWVGRRVSMGGVAGVVVAPEYRGRGVGTRLMREVLHRCRDLGHKVSALFPTVPALYRAVGFEWAGGWYRFSFPATALRGLADSGGRLRRGTAEDAPVLLDLVAQARSTERASGVLGWPEHRVREWLDEEDTFCYLADDGFVVYRWEGSDLCVDELVALSEATSRALWATVGSGSSVARTVHAYLAPHDPVHLMLPQEADKTVQVQRWMLRLVDLPSAVAARGWPPGVDIDVTVEVDDRELPDIAGCWRLQVSSGAGRLVRADRRAGPRRRPAMPSSMRRSPPRRRSRWTTSDLHD